MSTSSSSIVLSHHGSKLMPAFAHAFLYSDASWEWEGAAWDLEDANHFASQMEHSHVQVGMQKGVWQASLRLAVSCALPPVLFRCSLYCPSVACSWQQCLNCSLLPSAFCRASIIGNAEVVAVLLEAGADPNAMNGISLRSAMVHNHHRVLELLKVHMGGF